MTDHIRIVYISIPRDEAAKFARAIVEERLAACVNIIPKMESFYRWEGEVLTDSEALLLCKTSAERMEALEEYVAENHPYELPECVAIKITEGLEEYLEWIEREVE